MDSFIFRPTIPILVQVIISLAVGIYFLLPGRRLRKQAQTDLQDRESRFHALLEAISDALVAVDEQGLIAAFNPAAEVLFGHPRNEMLGRPLNALLPERFRDRHGMAMSRVFADGKGSRVIGQAFELPALRADGTEIWVELSLSLLADGGSRVVLATIRDISRRKGDEEALRLSEERFREMADLLPQSIFETDRQGVVTFANRLALGISGGSQDGSDQRHFLDQFLPEDRSRGAANMARVLAGEILSDEEYSVSRQDGSIISIMVSAAPILRQGEVVGIRGIAVDVSGRRRAERLLRESGEKFKQLFQKYQALLDNIPDAITLLAPDLTVVRSNLGAARLLGRPVTSLPGQRCTSLWRGCSAAEEGCPVLKSFKTGKMEKATTRTADGRSWRVRAFPVLNERGETVNVISHSRDVTRQLQMEQEARRSNHLASLGELAAGVAHEINNPINGIINYAQILADDVRVSEENREILRSITEEGERIANIVSNLLTFARARKEKKTAVSLGEVLAATLPLAGAQLRKDHIELRVDVDPHQPEVLAHTQQIQQVILNLVSNARYALNQRYPTTDKNKVLHIYSESTVEAGHTMVRLVFRDSGTGIPAAHLAKVMDPFYTTKPVGQGTGLGLSICHGILNDHGGTLKIDSVEGSHTAVAIELPAQVKGPDLR
jgi:PAS domain S-box-containing protein